MRCRDVLVVAFSVVAIVLTYSSQGEAIEKKKGGYLGIYTYENIEGYHTVSGAAGTEMTNAFMPFFEKVVAFDKVPLTSNETVRILEEMTKDRKIIVTAINSWLAGGVVSAPTVTIADDAIKFKDLTWHINQDSVLAEAKKKGMTHVIVGTFTGIENPVQSDAEGARKRLRSVNVLGNLRLMDVARGSVIWAKTYRQAKADFDSRLAFNAAVLTVAETAAKEAKEISDRLN
ncbi:MAG: hypothetical protein WC674_00195 [Candidatus Krumholzibacteriia bacterium]